MAGFARPRVAATKQALMPLLASYGISRVSELTGLDRIGIPVFSAVRPLAATMTVSAGKGFDADSAWVSAVMEAIEAHVAEQFEPDKRVVAAARDLDLHYDVMALNRHPASICDQQTRLAWTEALDIVDMAPIHIPVEAVGLRGWFKEQWHLPTFVRTSNGLAAGNTLAEATLHALLELVERDALDRSSISDDSRMDLDGIGGVCGAAIAAVRATGTVISLYRLTSLDGTYAFACYLRQSEMPQIFGGSGCHVAQRFAIERAVLEAVQSRMSIVSGLRDDIPAWMYDELKCGPRDLHGTAGPGRVLTPDPDCSSAPDDAIRKIVQTIHGHTGQSVIAIELQRNAETFPPVVQVFAPGMRPSPEMKVPA
ncbi:YcaO-like family protein [Bradyrhizobium pachyrhizi]|uniref:YcaO-like family protein n=1 Tax=Bradyrhizobium pachyrhizi TaxID=280333 RepID=UPI0024B26D34|nr:YcaO-like family protein [Bradyrhizobium pachyrhizi]WFU53623.1 YcaO-like family protein [Bradyrhizobium pachyrhizi]